MLVYIYCLLIFIYLLLSFFLGDKFSLLAYLNYWQYFLFVGVFLFFLAQFVLPNLKKFLCLSLLLMVWLVKYTPFDIDWLTERVSKHNTPNIPAYSVSSENQKSQGGVIFANLNGTPPKLYQETLLTLLKGDNNIIALQNMDWHSIDMSSVSEPLRAWHRYDYHDLSVLSKTPLGVIDKKNTPYGKFQILRNTSNGYYLVNLSGNKYKSFELISKINSLHNASKNDKMLAYHCLKSLFQHHIPHKRVIILAGLNTGQANDGYYIFKKARLVDLYLKQHAIFPWLGNTSPKRINNIPIMPLFRTDYVFVGQPLGAYKVKQIISPFGGSEHQFFLINTD